MVTSDQPVHSGVWRSLVICWLTGYQPERSMRGVERVHHVLLDFLKLGLGGDTTSVQQLAMRVLRSPPGELGDDAALREEIAKLVAKMPPRFTRGVSRPTEVAESELHQPISSLVRAEVDRSAPAPVVSDGVRSLLEQVLAERREPARLARAGLEPTKTLLLVGAPGVGKTMTARFLASRLGMPLVSADLAVMVSSYLGKTGQNLRAALDHARTHPCVFLLDEFDAVSKRRDDPTDVGELKRIVNVLLLELERWPPHSLLVAATNHAELLDRAVWRRFDKVIELGAPDELGRREILMRSVTEVGFTMNDQTAGLCSAALAGASGSDLVRFVREAARTALIGGTSNLAEVMRSRAVERLLKSALKNDELAKGLYCRVAHDQLGRTYREIAGEIGVSHVTVGKLMKRSEIKGRHRDARR